VDLGFGKFLEYFREFFGEKLTMAFIFCLALTVIAFCIDRFIALALSPIWQLVSAILNDEKVVEVTGSTAIAVIVALLIGAVLTYLGGRIVVLLFLAPKIDIISAKHIESINSLIDERDELRHRVLKDIVENGPSESLIKILAEEEERLSKQSSDRE